MGTDPVAYAQFAEFAPQRAEGLTRLSESILQFRQAQLNAELGDEQLVSNTIKSDSKGLPNRFALTQDYRSSNGDDDGSGNTASRPAYWAPPLNGIFASSPYLHNGSVPTLEDLLSAPDERPSRFRTGSNAIDPVKVGLKDAGSFVYDTSEPGKGNGGHLYGTNLPIRGKRALLEYLKSI